jgi:choline kinase
MWYVLHGLARAGITRCVVVAGYRQEILRRLLPSLTPPRMDIVIVFNPAWERANGLSVLTAQPALADCRRFLLHMSDHLVEPDAIRHMLHADASPALLIDTNPTPSCDLDDATRVFVEHGLVRRIGKGLTPFNGVDTGVFLLDHSVFPALREAGGRGDESLSGGMRVLAGQGRLTSVPLPSGARWQDVDTPVDLAYASREMAAGWRQRWITGDDVRPENNGGTDGFP